MRAPIGKEQRQILKKVLRYIRRYWGYLGCSVVLAAFTALCMLYVPVLIGQAVDWIIGAGNVGFTELFSVLRKMAVVIFLTAAAQWVMNVCNNKLTYHVVRDIRKEAFDKLLHLPLKYIDGHSNGEIVSRMITDVDQFADGLLLGFTQLFTGIVTIFGTLFFMLTISVQITAAVVILTPISLFAASYIAKKTFSMFRLQSVTRGEQTAFIEEIIGNQKVVLAFSQEREALEKFDVLNEALEKCSLRAIFFSSITNPATRFVNSLVYAAVGVIGAYLAIAGRISVGQLTSLLGYANQYTKPFNEISGVITELQNALACAGRVFELIEEEAETPDAPDAVVLQKADGSVCLSHVYFSYTEGQKLIEDFCLSVRPGQRVAIVGPTGCGKTTLINLLMRFYETNSGEIRVSRIPIKDMTRASLRDNYGCAAERFGKILRSEDQGRVRRRLSQPRRHPMRTALSSACRMDMIRSLQRTAEISRRGKSSSFALRA